MSMPTWLKAVVLGQSRLLEAIKLSPSEPKGLWALIAFKPLVATKGHVGLRNCGAGFCARTGLICCYLPLGTSPRNQLAIADILTDGRLETWAVS